MIANQPTEKPPTPCMCANCGAPIADVTKALIVSTKWTVYCDDECLIPSGLPPIRKRTK